ncbi:MAG: Penicillin-binding protein, 1A family, partial [Candidatus Gottesmanbacteria bacterium GW2011_GWA2_47_9]
KGKVLFEHKIPAARRVLSYDIAYLISHILSDNEARREVFGPKSYLVIGGKTVAVKTGTTDDKRDNWTVGYTPSIVVGAWVGNNDNSPMHPSLASGVTGAAPIWNRIIRETLKDKPDEQFTRPDTIIEVEIDAYGGGLPKDGYPTRKEIFIKGTEPTAASPIYQNLKISKKDSNKLANSVEVAKLEFDSRSFVVFVESDPVSSDGKNRWQEGIDAWVAAQGDAKFHPPTEVYEGNDQIAVTIREPGDRSRIDTNDVKVVIEAGSAGEITKIEVFVDGTLVKDKNDKKLSETINMSNGQHTIKAKAHDNKGNTAETEVHVAINEPYATPTPTPTPTP